MKRVKHRALLMLTVFTVVTLGLAGGATTQAAAQSLTDVGDEVDVTGRYVEKPVDEELEASIQRANDANIGFVWLDQGGEDAEQVAIAVSAHLLDIDSDYRSVVVLNNDSVWVSSRGGNGTAAGENARELFAIGDEAGALDLVTDTISGAVTGSSASTETESSAPSVDTPTSSGSTFPWIVPILLAGLAFLAFRFFSGKRRAAKQRNAEMEVDRLEIREQLRDNADRVIDLGDRVISSGDPEMIRTYEKASVTYQDVSQSIDEASTPEEVDRLDERIDEAEWQFEVIEAKLDGRPAPDSPSDLAPPPAPQAGDRVNPPAPTERPTVTRRGRSVPPLGGPNNVPAQSQNRQPQKPEMYETRERGRGRQRRNGIGGGMGGGLGRMLMSGVGRMVLSTVVSMLLGGARRSGGSRRTQRRSTGRSSGGGFGGGLGGGVLRRGR